MSYAKPAQLFNDRTFYVSRSIGSLKKPVIIWLAITASHNFISPIAAIAQRNPFAAKENQSVRPKRPTTWQGLAQQIYSL